MSTAVIEQSQTTNVRLVVARNALRELRTRVAVFCCLFAAYAFVQPVGFRRTYPNADARARFAAGFADNPGLRLLYGRPRAIDTVAGYTEWRVGGVLTVVAAVFGLFAAVRVLRAEEEVGRFEVVRSGVVSRRDLHVAVGSALAFAVLALVIFEWVGLVLGGIPFGAAAVMSLATGSCGVLGAAVGAVASQVASTRRGASGIGAVLVGGFIALRAVADIVDDVRWLAWGSPLGWAELVHPLTHVRALVLVMPVVGATLLVGLAGRLDAVRDLGAGLLPDRSRAPARLALLRSPLLQAFRERRALLAVWAVALVGFLFLFGVVAHDISRSGIPSGLQRQVDKIGTGSLTSVRGYLSFLFLIITVVFCLYAAAQIAVLSAEESDSLETVLAHPVGRLRWLGGRIAVSAAGMVALAGVSGLSVFAGARAGGAVDVGLGETLAASLNAVPVTWLFFGVGVLMFGLVPRACAAAIYALVAFCFLWDVVGSLLGPPRWVVDLSPFAHMAVVPAQDLRLFPTVIMLSIGTVCAGVGASLFRRRDLSGA